MKRHKFKVVYSGSIPAWSPKPRKWTWLFLALRSWIGLVRFGKAVEESFDEMTGGLLK